MNKKSKQEKSLWCPPSPGQSRNILASLLEQAFPFLTATQPAATPPPHVLLSSGILFCSKSFHCTEDNPRPPCLTLKAKHSSAPTCFSEFTPMGTFGFSQIAVWFGYFREHWARSQDTWLLAAWQIFSPENIRIKIYLPCRSYGIMQALNWFTQRGF